MRYHEFRASKQHIIAFDNISIEMNNLPNQETLIIITMAGSMKMAGKKYWSSSVKASCITDSNSAYGIYNTLCDQGTDKIETWLQ